MSATSAAPRSGSSRFFAGLQRLGLSLMLPIAVLPAAGLLLRFGQPDLLASPDLFAEGSVLNVIFAQLATAGDAVLSNLPILFAIGVAIGMTRRADASIGLSAVVGYLIFDRVSMAIFSTTSLADQVVYTAEALQERADTVIYPRANPTGALGGIFVGLLVAYLYTRFHRIRLVSWLAFFGGRRFVPIVTAFAAFVLGIVLGYVWTPIGELIRNIGEGLYAQAALGAGIYGMVNRLLIPFGLHHIVNNLIWTVFGEFPAPGGETIQGDLLGFIGRGEGAGGFEAGFYPIMMFALPAACVAMWLTAHPEKRAATGSFMITAALTSLITGVTEPIEFAFIFVAPVLFGVHVVLTGVSLFIANALGAKIAFSFSAGLIDYLLYFGYPNAERPWILIPLGLVFAVVYFLVFYWLIKRLNLPTPGREPEEMEQRGLSVIDQPEPERAPAATTAARPTTTAERPAAGPPPATESPTTPPPAAERPDRPDRPEGTPPAGPPSA